MRDSPVSTHPDPAPAAESGTDADLACDVKVPWLEGALLRFLTMGSVLDIKAPGDPDGGPVVPNATVTTMTRQGVDPGELSPSGERYDAIFSRGALSLAKDPRATLAAWFQMLRPDGYLVIVLPPAEASAQWAMRSDDPVALSNGLMQTVEDGLPAGSFRVVHLDVAAVRHTANCSGGAASEVPLGAASAGAQEFATRVPGGNAVAAGGRDCASRGRTGDSIFVRASGPTEGARYAGRGRPAGA